MKTPSHVSLADFVRQRDDWIAANCVTDGEFQKCRACETKVEIIGAYVSLHDARFDNVCAGEGAVIRVVVPYCPRCESRPAETGCVHVRVVRVNAK